MGRVLLALCGAVSVLAVTGLPAAAGEPAGVVGVWPAIDVGDWNYVGTSDVSIMYVKIDPATPGSAHRRAQVRFEEAVPFKQGDFASRSNVEVVEVDCAQSRTRILKDTRYTLNNMKGESRVDVTDAAEWKSEAPGTFGAGIIDAVCEKKAASLGALSL